MTPEDAKKIKNIFDAMQPNQPVKQPIIMPKPIRSTKPQSSITQEQEKYSINGIKFYFENGQPVYEVDISNIDKPIKMSGWTKIKQIKPSTQFKDEKMSNANKCYDQNIAAVLEKIDAAFGTKGLEQYSKLLNIENIYDKSKLGLNIDYDFSNLGTVEKENKGIAKYIKKIAKANYKEGRVSYEKAPNIFKRLWNNMKTLRLNPGANATVPGTNLRYDEYSQMKMEEELKNSVSQDNIIEELRSGVEDPNFSIAEFAIAKGLSVDEVKTYMENPKIMNMSRSEMFRLNQRISQQSLEHQNSEKGSEQNEQDLEETTAKATEQEERNER